MINILVSRNYERDVIAQSIKSPQVIGLVKRKLTYLDLFV